QRFRREARWTAALSHPNIVQVYEVGEHQGHAFLAMELVDGCSMAQQLGGRAQPPGEAARLVETLARAVHYAHQQGIVHRDLKPANVLIRGDGVPRVADFGLARQLEAAGGSEAATRTGAVVGTPSYMAPEQAQGLVRQTGAAADVWALGAI